MFTLAVKSIVFILPSLLPFHSKKWNDRKRQETTRKAASVSLLTFFLFLSKRENHCINMCDSQAIFSVTCNFNSFFWAFRHLHNISQICELTFQAHPSLFFFLNSFSCFFCFLNLEYTSNLLSSLSSTVIYFPLDANSPPTHFFFKKKKRKLFPFVCF